MQIINRLTGLFLLIFLFFVSIPTFAWGTVSNDIPPRPTLMPTPATQIPPELEQQTIVSSIILISDGEVEGLQTAVEWQDEYENWNVVEGWQAPFNEYKQVAWAVAAVDYGKGPFRWVVSQNDVMIESSSAFYLPSSSNEVVATHVIP